MIARFSRLTLATGAAAAAIASALTLGAVPAQAYTLSSNLFASVNLNGTLAYGNGVTGVTHLGTGQYEVTFSADVQQCAYVATTVNAYSQALQVFTAGGHLSADGVYVETKNQGGGLSAGIPFHLAVICPSAASTRVAVVAANGRIARGSRHTWSFSLAPGQYTLVTSRPLFGCAAIATRGSIDTAVPYDPATVEIVPGATRHTVGIQVRQLLFSGGNLASESFHAALVC